VGLLRLASRKSRPNGTRDGSGGRDVQEREDPGFHKKRGGGKPPRRRPGQRNSRKSASCKGLDEVLTRPESPTEKKLACTGQGGGTYEPQGAGDIGPRGPYAHLSSGPTSMAFIGRRKKKGKGKGETKIPPDVKGRAGVRSPPRGDIQERQVVLMTTRQRARNSGLRKRKLKRRGKGGTKHRLPGGKRENEEIT